MSCFVLFLAPWCLPCHFGFRGFPFQISAFEIKGLGENSESREQGAESRDAENREQGAETPRVHGVAVFKIYAAMREPQ